MPTDEELIAEIRRGSQAAMEVLVRRHYRAVFAYIYRRIGDYHAAFDLAQEVFIRMLQALPSYREGGKFEAWLLKIAVNRCRDYVRSPVCAQRAEARELDEAFCAPDNVTDLFEASLSRRAVREAVLALPDDQREAVILHYYHGYKLREIAAVTGAKEATVKSRVYQALSKLKRKLEGGGSVARP